MLRRYQTCPKGGRIFSHHRSLQKLREVPARLLRAARGGLALGGLLACGACASFGITDDDALVTGSITPRPTPVSIQLPVGAAPKGIAEADWAAAKGALDVALLSREAQASLPWENKASGAHGTATPISPVRAGGCRDFLISVVQDNVADRWIQGTACKDGEKTVLSQVRLWGGA